MHHRYCNAILVRNPILGCLLVGFLALFWVAAAIAVEKGRPSFTAQAVCAFRAIGAHDPDPKVRNPDHLAEELLGQGYWDRSGLTYHLKEMKTGRRALALPTLYWVTARTLHVDTLLKQAVREGATQVVILGPVTTAGHIASMRPCRWSPFLKSTFRLPKKINYDA